MGQELTSLTAAWGATSRVIKVRVLGRAERAASHIRQCDGLPLLPTDNEATGHAGPRQATSAASSSVHSGANYTSTDVGRRRVSTLSCAQLERTRGRTDKVNQKTLR